MEREERHPLELPHLSVSGTVARYHVPDGFLVRRDVLECVDDVSMVEDLDTPKGEARGHDTEDNIALGEEEGVDVRWWGIRDSGQNIGFPGDGRDAEDTVDGGAGDIEVVVEHLACLWTYLAVGTAQLAGEVRVKFCLPHYPHRFQCLGVKALKDVGVGLVVQIRYLRSLVIVCRRETWIIGGNRNADVDASGIADKRTGRSRFPNRDEFAPEGLARISLFCKAKASRGDATSGADMVDEGVGGVAGVVEDACG
jgi:hypothetical protein